jgi:predicted O-methyltransferase YrrM
LDRFFKRLFDNPDMLKMGHAQRCDDGNLGLGWLYYALARIIRHPQAVVIGSWRGFVPLLIARGLADNLEGGRVLFIDPSLADDFWQDTEQVKRHFSELGADHIDHYLTTTQDFVQTDAYRELDEIGMLFIDGLHTYKQAKFDFEAFSDRLVDEGIILFHDTAKRGTTGIYGPEKRYQYAVHEFVGELETQREFEVFNLPFGSGITLVKRRVKVADHLPQRLDESL